MIAARSFIFVGIIQVLIAADVVFMTGQLCFRQRRVPDSAGNTWSWSRKPRLPPDQAVRMMYERA